MGGGKGISNSVIAVVGLETTLCVLLGSERTMIQSRLVAAEIRLLIVSQWIGHSKLFSSQGYAFWMLPCRFIRILCMLPNCIDDSFFSQFGYSFPISYIVHDGPWIEYPRFWLSSVLCRAGSLCSKSIPITGIGTWATIYLVHGDDHVNSN